MNNISTLILILFAIGCNHPAAFDKEKIEKIALEIAESWNTAWNGDIDIDKLMSLHHQDLQYYWHGKPMTYAGLEDVLKKYVIGLETYNNKLYDHNVTVIDKNTAIISFRMGDSPENVEKEESAFTLVITRVGSEWKIIHIHEG